MLTMKEKHLRMSLYRWRWQTLSNTSSILPVDTKRVKNNHYLLTQKALKTINLLSQHQFFTACLLLFYNRIESVTARDIKMTDEDNCDCSCFPWTTAVPPTKVIPRWACTKDTVLYHSALCSLSAQQQLQNCSVARALHCQNNISIHLLLFAF